MSSAAETLRRAILADETCVRAGIELVETGDRRAVVRMPVVAAFVNPGGFLHAGYLYLLADVATGLAASGSATPAVSTGGTIAFLSPGRAGDTLFADAGLRARAGRTALYDVAVYRLDGAVRVPVAELRAHVRTIGAPTARV